MNIKNRIIAFMIAFLITVSPLQRSFQVSADEALEDNDLPAEETWSHVSADAEDRKDAGSAGCWTGTDVTEPDGHEETVAEDAVTENPVPKGTSDSGSGENIYGSIVYASSYGEYFDLIAAFPNCERLIVDTSDDLSYLKVSYGVYFDGTYILGFEDDADLDEALNMLADTDCVYALDGTVGVCGDLDRPADDIKVKPDRTVRVAVIDTGSDLADEKYCVTGEDPEDHNGHGTAMTSYILAETDDAYIISIKAIGDNGRGNMSDVYAAVQMAEEIGVDYILMAISVRNNGRYGAFESLIANAKAEVVASAGNNGSDASNYLPAGIEGVVTVGALEEDGTLNGSSNYGGCVDYYLEADTTSEAAARALGIIIDGRAGELAAEYITEPSEDNGYVLALRADDDGFYFVTDATKAGQNIIVYSEPVVNNNEVFVGGSDNMRNMFYYDEDLDPEGHLDDICYYSDALYCLQDWKWGPNGYLHPDGSSYSYLEEGDSLKMIQAACAFGPGGAMYEYGLDWWKTNDPEHEAVYLTYPLRSMYLITHYALCCSYDPSGYASHGSPGNARFDQLLKEYCEYLYDIRSGNITIPGITLSGWWCEIYECTMSDAVDYPDRYQNVCQGDVRVKGYVPVTVAKSSSEKTGDGYFGFEGTTYKLYRNIYGAMNLDDRLLMSTFVIKADGTADTVFRTNEGTTAYLRETVSADGFELDDSIYKITIDNDGVVTVSTVSGQCTAEVTNGSTVTVIRVSDRPDRAIFSLTKHVGENDTILAGRTYEFELWDNTANVLAASGSAKTATGKDTAPVVWSVAANGYKELSGNRLDIIPGHAYQIMETTVSVDGRTLETPDGWNRGSVHGKDCFYQDFKPGAGKVYPLSITNKAPVQMRITKVSSEPSVTSGNDVYSLAGAKYVLSSDSSFSGSGTVGVFTMKSDGTTDTILTVSLGSVYYLKETSAGRGYELDGSVYKIVVDAKGNATVSTYSGSGKATVTNGDPVVIKVADNPKKATFSLVKKLGENAFLLAGQTYDFELWDMTAKSLAAKGSAAIPQEAEASVSAPVVWSYTAKGYSVLSGNKIVIIPGHVYQIRELTCSVNGIRLDTPEGWTPGNGYFCKNFTAESDHDHSFSVTNSVKSALFALYKKIGTVNSVLAGRTYDFELWDMTGNVLAAKGSAEVPSDADDGSQIPVVWSDVRNGYSKLKDNRLEIIPEHKYQIRETTVSINGRALICPAGWNTGKDYYYLDFTSRSGQLHEFTATNNTSVCLKIVKASSDASATSDNKAYDLSGAEYVLSTDAGFKKDAEVGKLTVKSDGTTDAMLTVTRGETYYLKETGSGKGYELDDSVYKIVIDDKGNASVSTYSGKGTASVTNGDLIIVRVKDKPEMTVFSIAKSSSKPWVTGTMPNDTYDLAGTVYGLYTSPDGTGKVFEFLIGSDGTSEDSYRTYFGRTYYLKEIKAGKGFVLDPETYTITIGSDGSITAGSGAAVDNGGVIRTVRLTDVPKTAKFSLIKKLGTNAPLLEDRTFEFELWDMSSETMAAKGSATVIPGASSSGTKVIWTETAPEYTVTGGSVVEIIPDRSYQVRETTTSAGGRTLNCPSGWTEHGSDYFFIGFTADADKTYAFTATNSTDVRLSITKSSADPSLTDGNSSYTLAGAEYVLSSDDGFSDVLGVFRTGSDGTSDSAVNVTCGSTYYLKESKAPSGYKSDTSVYKIVIGNDAKATVSTYSGKGSASVTNGDPILINLKDRPETVKISLTKSSVNKDMTSGNSCYSLAGTVYGLYQTASDAVNDKGRLVSFKVGDDGNADVSYETAYGRTYYLKELTAGKGYMLDEKVYTVTVDEKGKVSVDNRVNVTWSGGVYRIALNDVPVSAPASWSILKQDANGWNNVTGNTLSGASFKVSYYDRTDIRALSDLEKISGSVPKATAVLTSEPAGGTLDGIFTVSIDTLSEADKTGYFNKFSSLGQLPLGTYLVTEIKAPSGYYAVSAPLVFYIAGDNGVPVTGTAGDGKIYYRASVSEIIMNEPALVGFYAPSKMSSDGSALIRGLHSLEGTRYGIYYKADNRMVCTVSFNASGNVSDVLYSDGITPSKAWRAGDKTIELAAGDYYAKELSAGRWFFLDGEVHEFSIEPGKTSGMELKDRPVTPVIRTSASDADTGTQNMSFRERVTVRDVVSYENLIPGEEYVITGTLYNAKTGGIYKDPEGGTYSKTIKFIPDEESAVISDGVASGKVTVVFDDVLIPLEKTSLVVFEKLYKDDILIASHEDLNDKGQTVTRSVPEIGTEASDAVNGSHILSCKETVSVNDKVYYADLNPGETYYITGTLYDASTGNAYTDSEGNTYTKTVEFTPETKNGTVSVLFEDVSVPFVKTEIVVFEELYEKSTDHLIAFHADISDKGQTVIRPEIHTAASDADTKTHYLSLKERVTVRDIVSYEGLIPGVEYTLSSSLYDAGTGELYKDPDGNTYTVTVRFTPAKADSGITNGIACGDAEVIFEDVYVPVEKKTLVVFEKLYITESNSLIASHADLNDKDQTVVRRVPEVFTEAADSANGSHTLTYTEKVTVKDIVTYKDLNPGETYVIRGTLYNADTGRPFLDKEGKSYSETVEFTASKPDGTATVTFKDVPVPYEKTTIVVFEDLYEKTTGLLLTSHADLEDEDQTVRRPEIHTTATDADTGTHFSSYKEKVSIRDSVSYENLTAGDEYVITGTLYDSATGDVYADGEGNTYTSSVEFRADGTDGNVMVPFEDVQVPDEGKKVVVFEKLYEKNNNAVIAVHEDITYEGQSVERRVPEISTAASDAENGTHILTYEETVSVNDVVRYRNLNPGESYCFVGTLYDASTGKPYTDGKGRTYTSSVEFTAESSDGEIVMSFKDVYVPFEKTTIVVFEELYEKTTGALIASHANLTDEDQTVRRPSVGTVATVLNAKEIWLGTTEVTDITVSDRIAYSGFEAGRTYRAEASLYKADGTQILKDGKPVRGLTEFVPSSSDGEVTVEITFSSEGLEEGDRVVVFEKIFDIAREEETAVDASDKGRFGGAEDIRAYLIAAHEDITDEDQTVTVHFRPMTGGIVPSYAVAGNVIATAASVILGMWFVISRKRRHDMD